MGPKLLSGHGWHETWKRKKWREKYGELEVRELEGLENWSILGGRFLVFSSKIGDNIFGEGNPTHQKSFILFFHFL